MTFSPRSDFVRVLLDRGLVQQCTDLEGLDAAAAAGPITAYVGYDLTARSLHVGHLISIMMLRWLQRTGHRPIVLLGGGTTKIGDPTGKDAQRPLLSDEQITANKDAIRRVFSRFLTFGERPTDAIMVDNADWLQAAGHIEFLREYGRHFTVGRMLTFDSVKLRLAREQPMSFLEFNYMLMQAADFHELFKRHGCILQMGGSDQWGNIVNGVELIRRMVGAGAFGLTTPLLTTAAGHKMGKTMGGAVWLNSEMLHAGGYHDFWSETEDADVGRFLKLFTDLPLGEISRLEQLSGSEAPTAKRILADAATSLLHGQTALELS